MKLKIALKVIFIIISILCFIVVVFMYSKLSFIDWPYLWAGIIFFLIPFFLNFKK